MSKQMPKITYVTLFADESIHPKYEAALAQLSNSLGNHYPMYIGNEEVLSNQGEFEHRSPIDTSIVTGHFQKGSSAHAKLAIEEASKASAAWGRTDWRERVRILKRVADLIDERKFEIAATITYEVGKNRLESLAEAWEAMDAIKYFAKVMEENEGYVRKMGPGAPGEDCNLVLKPLGVWPVISPFNFPFMLANGMASGALITGNSVVLKPTSAAPHTGLLLYKAYRDAGVPAGVVNYVTGPGGEFEKEFTTNPLVAGIAFTERRHELSSMGIRVNADTLRKQLEISHQLDWLRLPYHKGILNGELPLSIGGGIGQSRTFMLLLKKAHIGEVSVSVWPKILKEISAKKNIHVLE